MRLTWIALMVSLFVIGGIWVGSAWAGDGILKVITEPEGAAVTVDTGQDGISPCTLRVPEGKRTLRFRLRAHKGKELEVEVSSTAPTEIKVKLSPAAIGT